MAAYLVRPPSASTSLAAVSTRHGGGGSYRGGGCGVCHIFVVRLQRGGVVVRHGWWLRWWKG